MSPRAQAWSLNTNISVAKVELEASMDKMLYQWELIRASKQETPETISLEASISNSLNQGYAQWDFNAKVTDAVCAACSASLCRAYLRSTRARVPSDAVRRTAPRSRRGGPKVA